MNNKVLIDNRLRKFEKEKLIELGYELIEIPTMKNVYQEISSHVDIFACKINEDVILEENLYKLINYSSDNFINSNESVEENYPKDIKFNVAIIGNKVVHNFKYTSNKVKYYLEKNNFDLISVKQGYSNCSIAVIDDNSIIVSDKGIYDVLKDYKDLDILFIENIYGINLLNNCGTYSKKQGFIGGVISRIDNLIFVTGDLDKIDKDGKIRKFIIDRNLEIVDFKNEEIIDYGGILKL